MSTHEPDCNVRMADVRRQLMGCDCEARHRKAVAPAGSWPKECDWPDGRFTVRDEPGEHDPCWLIMPGGGMLSFCHHATNGVDQARAQFIADACNERGRKAAAPVGAVPQGVVTVDSVAMDTRIAELQAALASQAARMGELEQDALRYQVVRVIIGSVGRRSIDFAGCTPEKLDATIDKAINDAAIEKLRGEAVHG